MKVVCLLFCCLPVMIHGQDSKDEPVRYLNEEALLEADSLEDIPAYLKKRTERIRKESEAVFARLDKEKLEGLDFSPDGNMASGFYHLHLIRLETGLSILAAGIDRTWYWEYVNQKLYQRGLKAEGGMCQ